MMLILVFLVAVVVMGIIIAPIVAFICMTILMAAFWIFNFKKKQGLLAGKIISVIGAIASFFIAVTLSRSISSIKSFLLMLLIMVLISAPLLKVAKKISSVPYILSLGLCLIFSLMWTIGYEMDNKTKIYYDNLAYYQCDKIEIYKTDSRSVEKAQNNGKQLNGNIYDITDKFIFNITDDHIVDKYTEGDKIIPDVDKKPEVYSNSMNSYDKIIWYPVLTQSGQKGYIPDTGVNPVYNDYTKEVEKKIKNFKPTTWYAFLPDSAIEACEKLYETIPLFNKIYLSNIGL